MREYIRIKKTTAKRGCFLCLVFLVMCVACWLCLPLLKKDKPTPMVETSSRNELCAGGKAVAYFRGLASDSTFTGFSLYKDSVRIAAKVKFTDTELRVAMAKTKEKLTQELKSLEAAKAEADYYLGVHGVQDEGYNTVAAFATAMQIRTTELKQALAVLDTAINKASVGVRRTVVRTAALNVKPTGVFVSAMGGVWRWGRWLKSTRFGQGLSLTSSGDVVCGKWECDTIVSARVVKENGTYIGQMDSTLLASGHGCFIDSCEAYYEGRWSEGVREGFGFSVDAKQLRAGEWRKDKFLGERMHYTSERIYGIDISRYQHGKGRKYFPIQWGKLRITSLGTISRKTVQGPVDYPVSFVYIKSTEGTSVRNPYFKSDYAQAHRHKVLTGAYHFFSVRSSAKAQADYFLRHSSFKRGDMPPVLDVEPTDKQIAQMGGANAMFRSIRTWMAAVMKRVGVRPVLYVSQRFVNKYLTLAPDIKRDYNVWIARYGEYKPDVRLVYWQLCPDGRVQGIRGEVDVNVFNGYHDKFEEFIGNSCCP